ncbi:MAG TPA: 3-hydroxydecanoyl-ACP dehydratase [Holosporales bacterium]|nr:3-hydroxydecanoyl-ACP dehydratase [Holosporales bacterium]
MSTIGKFLPHDEPMVLLDDLLECLEESVHATVTPHKESPFCEQGAIPSYVALEYMAQSVAAWNGYHAHQRQEQPKVGFLLGSRRLTLHVPSFLVGETLNVYGKCQYNDGEMASFECWIEKNKERLAEATLNVYQPKDITQFNNET